MSGLLRRIKRSRDADAGEPPPGGEAVAPDAALTPAEPAAGPATPAAEVVPAGLDPAEAPIRPPAGRRGRLRRRLRYLRRARELMLRDLGGLLYEVHRTGGGQVEAHATVVGAKVQRLTAVEAEAHAIEQALGSPRSESVVFQPGVGGTCAVCGELFGSAARFCSNCGSAVGAQPTPAVSAAPPASLRVSDPSGIVPAGEQATESLAAGSKPRGRRAGKADGAADLAPEGAGGATPEGAGDATPEAATDAAPGAATGQAAPRAATGQAAPHAATGQAAPHAATGQAAPEAATEAAPGEAAPEARPDARATQAPATPFSSPPANGRADHAPPGLSSGDPLVTRERS